MHACALRFSRLLRFRSAILGRSKQLQLNHAPAVSSHWPVASPCGRVGSEGRAGRTVYKRLLPSASLILRGSHREALGCFKKAIRNKAKWNFSPLVYNFTHNQHVKVRNATRRGGRCHLQVEIWTEDSNKEQLLSPSKTSNFHASSQTFMNFENRRACRTEFGFLGLLTHFYARPRTARCDRVRNF